MASCVSCGFDVTRNKQRVVCVGCEQDVVRDLVSMSGPTGTYTRLVKMGVDALTPGRGPRQSGGGSRSNAAPPVRMTAMDLIGPGGMADVLARWVRKWHAELGFEMPTFTGPFETWRDQQGKTKPGRFDQAANRLINNMPWAVEHRTDFRSFKGDVGRMVSSCKIALDPASATPRVPIGRCPAQTEGGGECGTVLKADPWADRIKCHECGSSWGKTEWVLLGSIVGH